MAYLDEHPNPNTPQQRRPRRAPLSGTVIVHDAESIVDRIAPDTGAENVAGFIARRSDYGSYHVLCDSDSTLVLVDDDAEAWHCAEGDAFGFGMNSHSWGVSAACRTTDWDPDDPWTRATIARMGQAVREFWLRNGHDPAACARWISRDEAKRRVPGLCLHGTVQPDDRSDAWRDHPRRAELDAMLIAAITGGTTEGPDDMASLAHALTGKDDPTDDELRDGLGRLVLFHVSGQARGEAIARGEAVNTGNHLPWTTLADLVSDADALQLAVNTVSANRAVIVEALADLPLGDGVDAGDVAEAVVAALGAKLSAAGG